MSVLQVHFLNVGHGDSTVISHASGRLSMIDINNGGIYDDESFNEIASHFSPLNYMETLRASFSANEKKTLLFERGYNIELTNPIEFIRKYYPNTKIFRYIQTHPHMDHMRGLIALKESGIYIENFWDTNHRINPKLEEQDKPDWQEYQRFRNGGNGTTVLRLQAGASGVYYNESPAGVKGGDGFEILYPFSSAINTTDDPNELSYILRLQYKGISIILGGDAGKNVWEAVAKYYGNSLKCNILKASHHGRETGFHEKAVGLMSPEYTIVSVGKKPETDASGEYRKYSSNVWSTRWKGNISVTIDSAGRGNIEAEYER